MNRSIRRCGLFGTVDVDAKIVDFIAIFEEQLFYYSSSVYFVGSGLFTLFFTTMYSTCLSLGGLIMLFWFADIRTSSITLLRTLNQNAWSCRHILRISEVYIKVFL
jgi:hypothetical protein